VSTARAMNGLGAHAVQLQRPQPVVAELNHGFAAAVYPARIGWAAGVVLGLRAACAAGLGGSR
jgi:hypothetical protein